MKWKMLPNWCKKLGFLLFIFGFIATSSIGSFREGFNEGYNAYNPKKIEVNIASDDELQTPEASENGNSNHIYDVVLILGMIIYLFSREKIEDDYINKLRLESYQFTAIMGLVVTIVFYAFSKDLELTLDYFLILFLWTYLLTFAIKKRIY
jgi:hypothetical protein